MRSQVEERRRLGRCVSNAMERYAMGARRKNGMRIDEPKRAVQSNAGRQTCFIGHVIGVLLGPQQRDVKLSIYLLK
jgi:hypothetical protein